MQIRFLAGWKRLMMAVAIASLVVAPAGAAAPVVKGKTGGGTALSPGNAGQPADESSKVSEPVMYPRSNYVWPYSTGPVYGTLGASAGKQAGIIYTPVGAIDLAHGMPNLPSELKTSNRLGVQGAQYFLLQVKPEAFTNGSFDNMKRAITSQGGAILGEIPVAAFVVRITQPAYSALRASGDVIALEPYHPAFKLAPEIGRVPLLDPVKATSSVYSLNLRLFPGESSIAVASTLRSMGITVKSDYGDKVVVDADRTKLAAIANIDAVFLIEEVLPNLPMSEEMSTTIQTGRWNNGATPYNDAGIDGGGLDKLSQADDQLLMVLDTGLQMDAADLSNTRTDAGLDINGLPIAGHRKVAFYGTTNAFGGSGDLLGCDANTTSGFTHGHSVAVIALGNATKVPASYGLGWQAVDGGGNFWGLDGVAPKARLIDYDALVTPLTGSCSDPTQTGGLAPGDLYTAPSSGVLADGYAKGARVINFSWGRADTPGSYDANALDIDQFLVDHSDAAIFVAAGNTGRDLNGDRIPDPNTIGSIATAKNAIVIGASQTMDDLGDPDLPNARWSRSSNGPATVTSNRIAPLLMAPGQDAGTTGLASTYNCRSNDNGQTNPVECDVMTGISGLSATSYAAPVAAGAALLVRDYFAQGFYPDGTASNPGNAADKVATISGDLLKAILVTSADWMNQPGTQTSQTPTNDPWSTTTADFFGFLGNLTERFRGNREQGFGRIQLTNALPLQSYPATPTGLIVDDGGAAPAGLVHSTTLNKTIAPNGGSRTCSLSPSTGCASDADCTGLGTCVPYTFNVCDSSQQLTAAIAWTDPSLNDVVSRHLALQLTSPSGRTYLGNFFTDDINDSKGIDAGEECTYSAGCPWPPQPSGAGVVDSGPWSLPSGSGGGCTVTCTNTNSHIDVNNNVQAIFLSPDSQLNGIYDDPSTATNEAADNQVEQGTWSVLVFDPAFVGIGTPNSGPQNYSIAIVGGVCQGSAARVQKVLPSNQLAGTTLTCNDSAVLTIDEIGTTADPVGTLTSAEIASRTKVEVVDSNGNVFDTETFTAADFPAGNITQNGNNIRFDSRKLLLTEGTAPDSGNGVLDVRDGQIVRVTYQDESPNGTIDPNGKRVGTATVNCKPSVSSGGVVFGQFGKDAFTLVAGGCEKDARGYFTFGFPDRYMDAGELVSYTIAFQSAELGTKLTNVSISLKAVTADADSPASCKPGTTGICSDPNRLNNPVSPYLTVLDSPKVYGSLPAGKTLTPTFTIQMAPVIAGTQKVDMIVGITSKSAGKSVESLIAKRETLNADEVSLFYSTDFPTGGAEPVGGYDINNNEIMEAVTSDPSLFTNLDYVFENRSYSDMTAGGNNTLASLQAPWNFDTCSTGGKCTDDATGFVTGLNNTSRVSPGVFAEWGEDKNFNGRLDGFCSLDTTVPCTQGIPISEGCFRCSGNKGRECNVDADCQSPLPNEGTCVAKGSCNFSLGEDRDPANGALDKGWSTAGGCGWQTKDAAAATGGVWHTGLVRDLSTTVCLAAGNNSGRCQSYETLPDGDSAGDNEWWELLLTPVLNKVNQGVDGSGDPVYQVQINDWAWNMLIDLPDANTQLREEFDTDINKVQGVDLYNDTAVLNAFSGNQGAVSGGNSPITGGFNMFAQISKCVDTDGNGSPDHCGTAAGKLCGNDPTTIDLECTGNDISPTRGHCSIPPAQRKCTGSVTNCTADATCNGTIGTVVYANERCAIDYKPCASNADCGGGEGVCDQSITGPNREGKNSCYFEGKLGTGLAKAQLVYGLATPNDDDQANGYCNRSDSLNGVDKSKTCTVATNGVSTSFDSCSTLDAPYTSCNLTNHPAVGIDQYVQRNGPGRNFGIKNVNGPDMQFNTLEDLYGDTGNQFRAAVEFYTREMTSSTPSGFTGFGIAVDDMVISWKETRLDEDSHTHCASGGVCANLETSTGVSFEGNSVVNLTLTDATPYDATNPKNDCNGDGDYTDAAKHCWNLAGNTGSNAACTTVGSSCAGLPGALAGEYCYAPDSTDCNDNGKLDIVVKLTTDTPGETTGELAVLDQVSPGSSVYKASFPYSTFYDSPGTLFVVQSGTQPPNIRAIYIDRNDGTGSSCKNNLDPTKQGQLEADTAVTLTSGRITVQSYAVNNVSLCSLTVGTTNKQCVTNADCVAGTEGLCNSCSLLTSKPCTTNAQCLAGQGICTSTAGRGDPDGFADTNETINLAVQFANKSGVDVDDLTATLGTNSPNIECVTRSAITVGSLANGALSNTANYPAFQFKVANVNRTGLNQVFQATFTITMRSNKFDALTRSTNITLDLDLNAAGTQTTSAFIEDFEVSSGLHLFTTDTIDAGKNSIAKSTGYRCQYNDPFGLNSNDPYPSNLDCFLGFTADSTAGVNDWHVHNSTMGGMGRAFTGTRSLHWGVHLSASSPSLDVYRFKQLDAVKTINPVNMPLSAASPELNFAQQVSFLTSTDVNVTPGETPDRGVVEVQLASSGVPVGNWIKIYPYVNVYDEQGTDDFSNCVFDPIDDGNDEKSFFDPTDPLRSHGPSSTCFPEFTFGHQGDTDYRHRFDPGAIGFASDGPGLQGCSGAGCLPANTSTTIFNPGTWVRPRFSLNPFAGRTIRLRFLATTIALATTQTTNLFLQGGDRVGDDGWYIDDVHIDQALAAALTLSIDTATITPIPCGSCSGLTAALVATPSSLSGPGQIVSLDAKTSTVTSCLNGVIQYQFWTDSNGNAIVGDAGDTLLRDWTDNSSFLDAPGATTAYGVKIRCSTSATSCPGSNTALAPVSVTCPSTATLNANKLNVSKPSLVTAEPDYTATISGWGGNLTIKLIRGDLTALRSSGGIVNVDTGGCLANNTFVSSVTDNSIPASGAAYYLLRTPSACNVVASGSYGLAGDASEKVGAGGNRDADIAADADTCP